MVHHFYSALSPVHSILYTYSLRYSKIYFSEFIIWIFFLVFAFVQRCLKCFFSVFFSFPGCVLSCYSWSFVILLPCATHSAWALAMLELKFSSRSVDRQQCARFIYRSKIGCEISKYHKMLSFERELKKLQTFKQKTCHVLLMQYKSVSRDRLWICHHMKWNHQQDPRDWKLYDWKLDVISSPFARQNTA